MFSVNLSLSTVYNFSSAGLTRFFKKRSVPGPTHCLLVFGTTIYRYSLDQITYRNLFVRKYKVTKLLLQPKGNCIVQPLISIKNSLSYLDTVATMPPPSVKINSLINSFQLYHPSMKYVLLQLLHIVKTDTECDEMRFLKKCYADDEIIVHRLV